MRQMKQGTRFALLPVVAAAFAFSAHAQQGQAQGATAQQQMGAGTQQTAQASDYRAMRASNVIGADVRNARGQDIGQIEDLVININDGSIRYAVLSVDPGWFESERLYSVPPSHLRWGQNRDEIVLGNVSREQLERGGIERSQWNPNFLTDQNQTARLDRAWGQQQQAGGQTGLVRASDLLDRDIHGRGGEDIGDLEELVLNTARGEVHYAVVEFDRGWLQADRQTPVPLRALNFDPRQNRLVMNVTREQAQATPQFDDRNYANINDPEMVSRIQRVLVVTPVITGSAEGGQQTGAMGASGAAGQGQQQSMQQGQTRNEGLARADQLPQSPDVQFNRDQLDLQAGAGAQQGRTGQQQAGQQPRGQQQQAGQQPMDRQAGQQQQAGQQPMDQQQAGQQQYDEQQAGQQQYDEQQAQAGAQQDAYAAGQEGVDTSIAGAGPEGQADEELGQAEPLGADTLEPARDRM